MNRTILTFLKATLPVIVVIGLLMRCTEADFNNDASKQLIGSWKSVDNGITIQFDGSSNYTIKFNAHTSFNCQYKLDDKKENNRLYLYMDQVKYECAYQVIENDQLKLTQINPPQTSDTAPVVSVYSRVH